MELRDTTKRTSLTPIQKELQRLEAGLCYLKVKMGQQYLDAIDGYFPTLARDVGEVTSFDLVDGSCIYLASSEDYDREKKFNAHFLSEVWGYEELDRFDFSGTEWVIYKEILK